MQVYIANLGKYNEGEAVGAWFTPPICHEDVAEKLGLNAEYEEYAIHDYEAPIEIGEYTSIDELNRIYEALQELSESFSDDVISAVMGLGVFTNGGISALPRETLEAYFDDDAYARDVEIEGIFARTSDGIVAVRR